MAKAVSTTEEGSAEELIEGAGDAMILVIPRAAWNTLIIQGQSEGVGPGRILDKALRHYLEANGCQEAVDYLHQLSRGGS